MPAPDSASMMKEAAAVAVEQHPQRQQRVRGLVCHQVNRLSSAAAPARKPQVMGE